MKKLVKISLYIIVVLIVLLAAIRLILPVAAVKIANRKLPELLNTEASLGSLKLGLLSGYVAIRDLRIAQPEGFGEGDLLRVPELRVKVSLASLFSSPLIVEEVALTDWEVNVVKNRDGMMNVEKLSPPPSPGAAPTPIPEEDEEPVSPILVKSFSIRNLSLSYTDHAIAAGEKKEGEAEESGTAEPDSGKETEVSDRPGSEEEILRVIITAFDLQVDDLLIDPAADPAEVAPAEAVLTARIVQEPFSDGLLGLAARIGPVGGEIPPVNAVLRLGDLELKPLRAVVPGSVALALGGSALDLAADLAAASYILDVDIEVEVAGGHTLAMKIGGTPDEPKVATGGVLFGVVAHLGGGVGRLAGNLGGAGMAVASGTANTTLAVGKGAAGMVGSVGGGLFKSVTSAATGDLKGAVGGLSDATVGTAGQAVDTVGAAGGEMAKGATGAAAAGTGADNAFTWRQATPKRWEENWSAAREHLAEMPFPPPLRESEASGEAKDDSGGEKVSGEPVASGDDS